MWNPQNPFNSLRRDAARDEIYAYAGKILDVRQKQHPYKRFSEQEYNREIYFIAGSAKKRKFFAFEYMTQEEIARAIGDSISRYLWGEKLREEERARYYRNMKGY
jgi:hypothetical protein